MPMHLNLNGEKNLVEVKLAGQLTPSDFQMLLPCIENIADRNTRPAMLVELSDSCDLSPAAAWESIDSNLERLSHVGRLAVVGDASGHTWMATFSRPFTTATTRYFPPGQKRQAQDWLKTPT